MAHGETVYGVGGFNAAHPSTNKVEEWDTVANTYTRWDVAGAVVTTRALTANEVTRYTPRVEDANRGTIEQRAGDAIASNNTYLAIATPNNAQVVAQVRLLTRECSAVIRLLLNRLDATD